MLKDIGDNFGADEAQHARGLKLKKKKKKKRKQKQHQSNLRHKQAKNQSALNRFISKIIN